jgi:hypothetical protein
MDQKYVNYSAFFDAGIWLLVAHLQIYITPIGWECQDKKNSASRLSEYMGTFRRRILAQTVY